MSAFAPIFFRQKSSNPDRNVQKSFAQNFHTKKAARQMLVKLTPGPLQSDGCKKSMSSSIGFSKSFVTSFQGRLSMPVK